jgi:hypothetical protein
MKGLSKKSFLHAAHSSWQLAIHVPGTFKPSHDALAPDVQRTSKPLQLTSHSPCRPFLFLLWSCRLHSRLRGHLQRRANHGSICDSSLLTGPMTISGYAWGHIVATGPQP